MRTVSKLTLFGMLFLCLMLPFASAAQQLQISANGGGGNSPNQNLQISANGGGNNNANQNLQQNQGGGNSPNQNLQQNQGGGNNDNPSLNLEMNPGNGGGGPQINNNLNMQFNNVCLYPTVDDADKPFNIQTTVWFGGCCGTGDECLEIKDYTNAFAQGNGGGINNMAQPTVPEYENDNSCGGNCRNYEDCNVVRSECNGQEINAQELCFGTIDRFYSCECAYDNCDMHAWVCEDEDGGNEPTVAGATTGYEPLTDDVQGYHDTCLLYPGQSNPQSSGNYVREYVCHGNGEAHPSDQWCEFGCEDGACRVQATGDPEICDGIDNDGDDGVDEGCDDDDDNYCDALMGVSLNYYCDIPLGYGDPEDCCYLGGDDCSDVNADINPGELDICDGWNNDCLGGTDDANACMLNEQCNGFFGCGCQDGFIDNDGNPINGCEDACYGAVDGQAPDEICDGIDNDCDGITDEGCDLDRDGYCAEGNYISLIDAAILPQVWYPSGDVYECSGPFCCQDTVDSYVAMLPDEDTFDCDDQNFFMSPGHVEAGPTFCTDGIDNDCDGVVDFDEKACRFMLVCESEGYEILEDEDGEYFECEGGEDFQWCAVNYGEAFQKCNTENLPLSATGENDYHVFVCSDQTECDAYYSGTFTVSLDPAEDSDNDGILNSVEDANLNGIRDNDETDAMDAHSDDDSIPDGQEDINKNGVHDPIIDETDPRLADTDADGLDDDEEVFNWETDPNVKDTDGDTFWDGTEVGAGTDPLDPNDFPQDADGDGIADAIEQAYPIEDVDNDGLPNYQDQESDGDGILDGDEDSNKDGVLDEDETNPYVKDTEGDGVEDNFEIFGNYALGASQPRYLDTDGDGLNDGEEDLTNFGVTDADETDPTLFDTDGDTFSDGAEINAGTDPLDSSPEETPGDIDQDGIPDVLEGDDDPDGDGIPNAEDDDSDNDLIPDALEDKNGDGIVQLTQGVDDPYETDPYNADTDGDGILDGEEDADQNGELDQFESDPRLVDSDGDGLNDPEELLYGTFALIEDSDFDMILDGVEDADLDGVFTLDDITFEGETNALMVDTDWDSLIDGVEDANQNGIVDENETDPRNPDTDGDGVDDGAEKQLGFDPLDPDNTPLDSDGDCIPDALEAQLDSDGDGVLNVYDADSDNDWLLDGIEVGCDGVYNFMMDHSDHLLYDTDGDCYNDFYEYELGSDAQDPADAPQDTDGECVPDAFEAGGDEGGFMCENTVVDEDEQGIDCGPACAYDCNPMAPLLWPGPCVGGVCYHGCHEDFDCDGFKDDTEIACATPTDDPLVACADVDPTLDYSDDEHLGLQNSDTDRDGLSNYDELFTYGTNPANPDTDGDGYYDNSEVDAGTDPLDDTSFPQDAPPSVPSLMCENGVQDAAEEGLDCGGACLYVCENGATNGQCEDDLDCDGWKDATEEDCGSQPDNPTDTCSDGNPLDDYSEAELEALGNMDTDGDGLTNLEELQQGTNPNVADSDGDGWDDGTEVNNGTDPLDASDYPEEPSECVGDECNGNYNCVIEYDADCDGLYDYEDMDADGDGINDGDEVAMGTNPNEWDSDGDGFSDGAEVAAGTDPNDPNSVPVDTDGDFIPDVVEGDGDPDGDGVPNFEDTDSDGDGLMDSEEDKNGDGKVQYDETNAYKSDSDDDGYSDKEELDAGSDPLDPDSIPGKAAAAPATLAERIEKSNANAPPAQGTIDRSKFRPQKAPTKVEDDAWMEDELVDIEESSSMFWIIASMLILGIMGAGGYFGYMYYYKPAHTPQQSQPVPGKKPNTGTSLQSQLSRMQQKKRVEAARKKSLASTLKSRIKKKNAVVKKAQEPLKKKKVDFKPQGKNKSELDALKNIAGEEKTDEIDALDKLADTQEAKKKRRKNNVA